MVFPLIYDFWVKSLERISRWIKADLKNGLSGWLNILLDISFLNSFNELDIQDQLDLDFPCDESLIQTIIELTVSEIAKLNGLPKDFMNNANDDVNLGVRGGKE